MHFQIFQKLMQKTIKKGTSNMKVYNIIPLTYRMSGYPENCKVKLYYFQEKLSLQYNIILKLQSVPCMCKLNDASWNNQIRRPKWNDYVCIIQWLEAAAEKCSLKINVPNFRKYKEF